MYGGYGNLWNQSSAQWSAAANVTNQAQLPMQNQQAQSFQQVQQQNMMGFTGNLGNLSNQQGMIGTWGMNAAAAAGANPFMNYGGTAAGYGIQPATTTQATWLTNQHFQLQQSFPGGRPPLPPGPPPPDPPKDTVQMNQFGHQTQAPPLPPSSNPLGFNISNQQQRAPPPPPPPPPAQSTTQMSGSVLPGTSMNIEDALNIIKKAAAYANLPSGSLAPVTTLNVSEELFGSKKSSKGIPGLDVTEDDKPATPSGPEVVDLEKESENFDKEIASMTTANNSSNTAAVMNKLDKQGPNSTDDRNNSTNLIESKTTISSNNSTKKEVVWELRPDAKTQEWTRAEPHNSTGVTRSGNNGWAMEQTKTDVLGKNSKTSQVSETTPSVDKKEVEKTKNTVDIDSKNRVTIPLESADGKELVYDRRILKQFDQKFREWENQFEEWKRKNQKHPNQAAYKQFLDQWNFWREQLIEQRRSILDKMMKAKLDCKDILMAKFESLDGGDNDSEDHGSVETSSSSSQPKEPPKNTTEPKTTESKKGENPFETAFRGNDGVGKPTPPMAPLISPFQPKSENNSTPSIPPLLPGLGDKNSDRGRDRPVERILRDSGKGRGERNMFDNDFKQNPQDQNPFMINPAASRFERKFDDRGKDQQSNKDSFDSAADSNAGAKLPFEWTLPSQNKQNKNPFDASPQSNMNPFMQPSGPNPFDMKPEQRLPSLDDFIKRTSLDFHPSSGSSSKQLESTNPFGRSSSTSLESHNPTGRNETQFERIPRDPQPSTSNANNPSNKPLRLEPNPIGMPLLVAAKESSPPEPRYNEDNFSHLFSRDRGPDIERGNVNDNSNFDMDDDLVENAEIIDYGAAGGNSMDSMDFPRGENPDANNNDEDDDPDFSLEDSEVIDYSQGIPPQDLGQYSGPEGYGGYSEEFENTRAPWFGPGGRGRGRGFAAQQSSWGQGQPGRGQPRGFPPGHPGFARGGGGPSHFPPDFSTQRGRGASRGMGRGIRGPAPQQDWFQHDDRDPVPYRGPAAIDNDPEVVELSPSPPELGVPPGIKIAPPNPDFDRNDRRRSRSRERGTRDRSRSRSRERVNRRGRDDFDRRGDDSSYGSRRERDRDRRGSPDRRGRYDERDRRDRDRYRDKDRRGRSKSRSPVDDRGPVVRNPLFPSASAGMLGDHSASNPPPPRYQTVLIEDILNTPGRSKRPSRLVIFLRGLPGSGKSHIVKLIKEREVEMGGKAPRILSLDNYFITEMEKKEKDPVTGVEVKKTVMEYEYDEEREPLYRAQLVRQFKKTLDEGFFSFVIVDCVNEFVRQFEEMATFAIQKRFQVYVAEIEESVEVCVKKNTHRRTKDEILKIHRNWERTPAHFVKLDTRTLLQDEAIQDVEMEDVSDVEADSGEKPKAPTPAERGKIGPQVVDLEDIEDEDSGDHLLMSSKWDAVEPSQEKLNKLDGLMRRKRANSEEAQVESARSIDAWLTSNMPEEYVQRPILPGQKRVRWADIEERREQERMREVGFVVGQTDWKRMMDPTFGSSALTKTKFF